MTAYRQQALACASALARGPQRPRDLKPTMPDAPSILSRNVYGWFRRVERGVYGLTKEGHAALKRWPQAPEIESAYLAAIASVPTSKGLKVETA